MQPLCEAEESAPAVLLPQESAGAGIQVNALQVGEADDGRAVSAFEDLELLDLRAGVDRARPGDEIVERKARAARGHLAQLALGERLQLRAEHQREAGDREEHGHEPYGQAGPAMNVEDAVAKREIHRATLCPPH